jgi:hypothetical protein
MNKTNKEEPDLDKILKQAFKDDLPSEAEAAMNRQFLNLKRRLDRPENVAEGGARTRRGVVYWPHRWLQASMAFRQEILAFASSIMLILGIVMHLSGSQSALADSIEQLKVMGTISASLNRVASMDCIVLKPEAEDGNTSYHVFWSRANGDARVDMISPGGAQTIWISGETISFSGSDGGPIRSMPLRSISPGTVWQPAMEFRNPALFTKHMTERYGLMQTGGRSAAGSGEFLIIGREGPQAVEMTVDAKTYLPKVLKKYALDSGRMNGDRVCLVEARFRWNQSIPGELLVPGQSAGK